MLLLKHLNLIKGLLLPLLLLAILMLVGSIGYMLIDGYTFLEGLYMIVITVSSVGFMEVN